MTTQQLNQADATAERVILDLENGEDREARDDVQRLTALVRDSGATAQRDAVESSVASALRIRTDTLAGLAARRAPALAVAEAANRVRDLVAEEAERNGDGVTAALLRLGYLEREVELRSLERQRRAATAAGEAATHVWKDKRAAVAAAVGEPLAERFDRHLARLQGHEGRIHIQAEARHGLELLSMMRRRPSRAGASIRDLSSDS